MTNKEAIERIKDHMFIHKMNEPRAIHITQALKLAIKALHTVEIINEELSPADEDKAIWFDIPYWEEIQERAEMRVKNELN